MNIYELTRGQLVAFAAGIDNGFVCYLCGEKYSAIMEIAYDDSFDDIQYFEICFECLDKLNVDAQNYLKQKHGGVQPSTIIDKYGATNEN